MKQIHLVLIFIVTLLSQTYTQMDSLRGSITPERAWWDLTYYHLKMDVNISEKFLSGTNLVRYKVLKEHQLLQIDLQQPMKLTKVVQNGVSLQFKKVGYAHFIYLKQKQVKDKINELTLYFEGHPKESPNPPWSGGITWNTDKNGKPFVASSCQGDGASLWWPNKDHMYDEVDSMRMSISVPEDLINVSNGRLEHVEHDKARKIKTFHWVVKNPINNYGVNINIGDYVHFGEVFSGEKGNLDCDYWVLSYNLEKAKVQFKDAKRTLQAFEHWFGPYPFYEDSYKLVEAPYLGMEHQSSVTYGNNYLNGYKGKDLSNTGWGLTFDFIIVHETGHEWFANNITYKDIADMWIHESFTAYSENLFIEFFNGKQAGAEYVIGTRSKIRNTGTLIGDYHVNKTGTDLYYKGANMLHTLRQIVNDDKKWRHLLRSLNKVFYHKTVTTQEFETYISQFLSLDLSSFFNQYLRDKRIPILEYRKNKTNYEYRWSNVIQTFSMPIKVALDGKEMWLNPTTKWKTINKRISTLKVDKNFYIVPFNILGN